MVERDELIGYLDALLECDAVDDVAPNGLQVEGSAGIRSVVTGVSACRELFVRAGEAEADLVLVHHGLFWRGDPPQLTGVRYARVAELVRRRLNLAAYHLPLDRHPELGNNALAARRLGLEELEPFGTYRGTAIGFRGTFPRPLAPAALVERCRELFGQEPLAFAAGRERIGSLGIVSGAGSALLDEAVAAGLDAFLTGEPREHVKNAAEEAGVMFLACGHYATERLGIEALGRHLAERFALEVVFVDLPNPI